MHETVVDNMKFQCIHSFPGGKELLFQFHHQIENHVRLMIVFSRKQSPNGHDLLSFVALTECNPLMPLTTLGIIIQKKKMLKEPKRNENSIMFTIKNICK